jgi:hypothetical protein
MNVQNAIAAVIHDRLGQKLAGIFQNGVGADLLNIDVDNDSLVGQLTSPGEGPPRITIGFGLDVLDASISTLLDDLPTLDRPFAFLRGGQLTDLVRKVHDALRGRLVLLEQHRDAIAQLVATQDPVDLRAAADRLFGGVLERFRGDGPGDALVVKRLARVRTLLGQDASIALPFATVFDALRNAGKTAEAIPKAVEEGLLHYFFTPAGFKTVDGERVVAPIQLSNVKDAFAKVVEQRELETLQLRGLFSKTNAERYLRDTIRVVVETAYDAARGLRKPDDTPAGEPHGRFDTVASKLKQRASQGKSADAIERQFIAWLRGFASMAESGAMRGVEVGTQGVSEFQTNPLIAAAAGSFAGTVARKLAHDSFLSVLETELK